MEVTHFLILALAGAVGGAANAVVGGGTFFTFPVLLALGVPPIAANATNTVALWPASIMAARAYLPELRRVPARLVLRSVIAFVGGILGALLLLASGDALFYNLVPWLLALATILFAFSKPIVRTMRKWSGGDAHPLLVFAGEFVAALYGGYFGAGLGILLMAVLALGGQDDPQVANGQKNLLSSFVNGAASGFFVLAGTVLWGFVLAQVIGAIAGGYFGAKMARRIPAFWLRAVVITVGVTLTLVYFYRVYG
jgi:uncharacterized membrane protein YfcA